MKSLLRILLKLCFGFRAPNDAALNAAGPILLVPNHVSWLDWLFLAACLPADWKFVTSSTTAQRSWLHRRVMINRRTLSVNPDSPYAVKQMAEHLRRGGRLVLFAEGRLSRTGSLMKLFEGTGFLLLKTNARAITCYLRGANRLLVAPNSNRKEWFPRVSAHFSEPLMPPKLHNLSTTQARSRLTDWLRQKMVEQQFEIEMAFGSKNVLAAIVEAARKRGSKLILEDANGAALTYRHLLTAANVFAQQWRDRLPADCKRVGVLLPNVSAFPVVLLSLWSLNKVPAILNFTLGIRTMLDCAELAQLEHVITSRAFLERATLKIDPLVQAGIQLIYLEDVHASIGGIQKLAALLQVTLNPDLLLRGLTATQDGLVSGEGAAVIMFTSGSEGAPKGVELSHANLMANIRQMLAVGDVQETDRAFNCLPLFHSFGLTIGTLLPLVRGLYVFLYLSPLHYRKVPTACYDRDCTILLSTNTFLKGYARKANAYDFRSLRYLLAGAEKLQETTARFWSEHYGVRILEGYGATECSPCISANTPLSPRPRSVGRLLPGMEWRLEPVEGLEEGGRLFVRGPNVMRGYLNPDADAQFKSLQGWYDTGDIARLDADGYLYILGRLKRFAKVSGEMVSLTAVEDVLAGAFPQFGLRCAVAILACPDERKGEVLVAVTNEPRLSLEEIRRAVQASGLSNLYLPREIKYVRKIPRLGTGKINHRELAMSLQASEPSPMLNVFSSSTRSEQPVMR